MLVKVFEYPSLYFNVVDTLECGQVFRYKKIAENHYGVYSKDKYAELVQSGDKVEVFAEEKDKQYFWHYFDLDTDYSKIVEQIASVNDTMRQASGLGKGIRILNQDLVEMIFSFIISANNNIKRIQQIVDRICTGLGTKTQYGYAFPTLEQMSGANVDFFANVGAGYRDKYLVATAQKLLTYNLDELRQMTTKNAHKELLTFLGVGPKVADCILLFGMHRGDVFPVDTWLKKAYHAFFEAGHADKDISNYFCGIFGQNSGLAQQYLFYFLRKSIDK